MDDSGVVDFFAGNILCVRQSGDEFASILPEDIDKIERHLIPLKSVSKEGDHITFVTFSADHCPEWRPFYAIDFSALSPEEKYELMTRPQDDMEACFEDEPLEFQRLALTLIFTRWWNSYKHMAPEEPTPEIIGTAIELLWDFLEGKCGDREFTRFYGGTEAQWNTVQIEASNSSLTFATIHYNSAGPDQPTQPTVGGFSDVKASDYYAEPVAWAVEKGVTAGTSKTTFSPNATCTQGQILTFLWRAKGEPKPVGTVSGTQYYAAAAQWAKEQGLTDNFSAEADCTRAMVVTYLWKLAGSPKAGTSNFSDVPANADYAQAVAWAVEQGITSGVGNGQFAPNSTCTRGQIVAFLYRAFVG